LTDAEIERMRNEAKANEAADKKAKERIDKLNLADSVVFQSEKQLKEWGDKIPADKKAAIESAIQRLKDVHKQQLVDEVDNAVKGVNDALQAAAQDIANAQAGAQQGQGFNPGANPNAGANDAKRDQNVDDVDFEEVK
jgi:molecular chaperone DnaK